MKSEKIHFGQVAYKFEVSQGLVDRINAKCETLDDKTNAQDYLVGKIKNEYHFLEFIEELDTGLEIKNSMTYVLDNCPHDECYEIEEIDINSAWKNDQYEHEYQGVHTHSGKEDLGFSSILYLLRNFSSVFNSWRAIQSSGASEGTLVTTPVPLTILMVVRGRV